MDTIGFIGSGNMAEALIKGIIAAGVCPAEKILVADIREERLDFLADEYKVTPAGRNPALCQAADVVVLSVKPQNMNDVLGEIAGSLKQNALVISIAAGVTTEKIAGALGDVQIIRVMPNTPALIGEGASALYSRNASDDSLKFALKLLGAVGKTVVVETEKLIDVVTAVSGSGPAYFFLLMEEMINAAKRLGLPGYIAKELVMQTAKGAGLLAERSASEGQTPAELREKVTSPGGTTEAALKVFAENNFSKLIENALTAARNRSKELSG